MSNSPEAPPDEQELALRLARAGEHLRADRLDEAESEIDAVLTLLPHDVRARNMQGLLHFRAGRFPEARVIYSELLGEFGEDASLRLNLGLVELRMGNYQSAVHHLGWVAEAEPDNARAQGYFGLALMRAGETAKARVVLSRAGQDELVRQLDRSLGGDEAPRPSQPPQVQLASRPPESAARAQAQTLEKRAEKAGRAASTAPRVEATARAAAASKPATKPATKPPAHPAPVSEPPRAAVADARLAVAAGARALDGEQPFAAPVETPHDGAEEAQGQGRDWQVRQPAQILPGPAGSPAAPSSQSPLRPIPLPERRSHPPGLSAGPSLARTATPLGQFLRERELAPPEGAAIGVTPDGLLVVRVQGSLPTRSVGVIVSTGEMAFEPLQRRARGRALPETFGDGPMGLFRATGQGMMVISPRGGHFLALGLSEESVYLRESATFTFDDALHWENGRIPGSGPQPHTGHPGLPEELSRVVQFRGTGQVVLRTERPLITVRLTAGQTSFIEVEQLVGWTGRIIPSLLIEDGGVPTPYVECAGDGHLLIEPPPREGNPAPPLPEAPAT